MYIFLKTSHPCGIRTRDLLYCRRTRWPLFHAARASAMKSCRVASCDTVRHSWDGSYLWSYGVVRHRVNAPLESNSQYCSSLLRSMKGGGVTCVVTCVVLFFQIVRSHWRDIGTRHCDLLQIIELKSRCQVLKYPQCYSRFTAWVNHRYLHT
jgi:hypothetical protein